ncbi:thymidylate synthase [Bacteroidota bacterium]
MHNIPVITVSERSLALAFEKALVELYKKGIRFKTQYDKPGDPESLDCTLNLTIEEPDSEPMIHMAFPAGIEDLKEYVMELKGFKDDWIKNMNDAEDTRWEYTYHGRLENYGTWKEKIGNSSETKGSFCINQIEAVIDKLSKQPFTRQAQMITWIPNLDLDCFDPPCLQSLWYRILEDDNGVYWLNCNIRFRSNDAWGASFMNMFGFIQFNKDIIAEGVARKTGKKVRLGRLNWHADSYHIYGKDIEQARAMLFDRIDNMQIEERTFDFSNDYIKQMYNAAEPAIVEKIKKYKKEHA